MVHLSVDQMRRGYVISTQRSPLDGFSHLYMAMLIISGGSAFSVYCMLLVGGDISVIG